LDSARNTRWTTVFILARTFVDLPGVSSTFLEFRLSRFREWSLMPLGRLHRGMAEGTAEQERETWSMGTPAGRSLAAMVLQNI
jgi:hypothetical protein